MDITMFQLRSFVHQRLYTAAEEILGEVEKAIALALNKAEISRRKEEAESPPHRQDFQRKKSEPSPPSGTEEHGAECEASRQQEKAGLSTLEKSNFSVSPEVPGSSGTSTDVGNWNYCLVQVGDVSVPGILPESLSSQIPLPQSELASLKMPKKMKRKRTVGPNSQGNSSGTQEQGTTLGQSQHSLTTYTATTNNKTATTSSCTAIHSYTSTPTTQDTPAHISPPAFSTQDPPAATPAPSPPKIFKEICSILPLSSGGKKKRCKITVEELARRVGPPEYMSFSSLVAYLRADNNTRKELQAQLEEAGIKPSDLTTEITLFSRLCEEEIDALCESLADLVQDHLPFQDLHVIPEAEDELVTLGRLVEFRFHLKRAIAAIKGRVEVVDLASHGFMSKMLDIILFVFERCLDNQMSGRLIY